MCKWVTCGVGQLQFLQLWWGVPEWPLHFASSVGHEFIKWGASSSCAQQSLQDGSPQAESGGVELKAMTAKDPEIGSSSQVELISNVLYSKGGRVWKIGLHIVRYSRSLLTSACRFSRCRWARIPSIFLRKRPRMSNPKMSSAKMSKGVLIRTN